MGLLTQPKTRIRGILSGTLDVSTLTEHTRNLYFPSGYLTPYEYVGKLDSPQCPGESFHRRFQLIMNASAELDPNAQLNEHDGGNQQRIFTLSVRVGYLWGIDVTIGWGNPQGSETSELQQLEEAAYDAAITDSVRMARLFTISELIQMGTVESPSPDPEIVSIRQSGPSQSTEVSPTRIIHTTDFLVILDLDLSKVYGA